jgi:hypothetical protein
MPPEDVKYAVEDVKQFVERLKKDALAQVQRQTL